ncbi:MAG TPA: glycosyltransferase [Candidatus Limnocylindria bacterium]|nr:glycosyltransferase [Candidatus Limnocylindria bacterium]
MNITFFGTYDTSNTPRVQALIDGMRAHDHKVTECNAPLKVNTASRVAIMQQPWRLPLLGGHILRCWVRLIGKSRHLPPTDLVIVGHLGQFDIQLAHLLFRKKPIALDYMISGTETANDRGAKGGLKTKVLGWLDQAALKKSAIIIVDTEEHRLDLPGHHRSKGVVVNVGAPPSWFEAGEAEAKRKVTKPISIAFFGNYIPLQGAPIIAEATRSMQSPVTITMVGPHGQDFAKAQAAARPAKGPATIKWVDHWVPIDELPALMAQHDVCLGVFGTSPKTYKVVPNKVYQCAAAGGAIVTSDTPSQRRVFGASAIYTPPGDAHALADALDKLANNPKEVQRLRAAAFTLAKKSFRPEQIIRPFLKKLEEQGL